MAKNNSVNQKNIYALSALLAHADAIKEELDRRECVKLSTFVKRAWHIIEPSTPYVHGKHIDLICDHLEAIADGKIRRLIINIPPGTSKSTIVGVFFPMWLWGPKNKPGKRFVGVSHEQTLGVRDNLKCRRLAESEWYQKRWGSNVKLTRDQNEKLNFENAATGFRLVATPSNVTGRRGDIVIVDDPISVENSNSLAERNKVNTWFQESLPSRMNSPENSAIVLVMQRTHENDPTGFILKNKWGWEHLVLPMRYEPDKHCKTTISKDWRTESGELLFPERFPEHIVKELELTLGSYASAGQLQQNPIVKGGNLIKSQWFGNFEVLPEIKYRIIFADTAQKTAEHNDYSVFQCWGYGDDKKIYLIAQIRGKWEAPELERRAVAFWQACYEKNATQGQLRSLRIEDKASGTGLIQKLKSVNKLPIVAIQRTKDKYTRALDILSYIEAGYVMLPSKSPFLNDFLSECEAFNPDGSHLHDDQVDCLIDACAEMLSFNNLSAVWETFL